MDKKYKINYFFNENGKTIEELIREYLDTIVDIKENL